VGGLGVGGVGVGMLHSEFWKVVQVEEAAAQAREPQHAYGVELAHVPQVPVIMSAGYDLHAYESVPVPALNWFVPHVE
jgi:queuine/archaeosine tRNA-ribosyltransferase